MPPKCTGCGVPVDRLRDPARIQAGRVVTLCRECGGSTAIAEAPRSVPCGFCERVVPEWLTQAIVVAGAVKVRCAACAEGRPSPRAPAPDPSPPPPSLPPMPRAHRPHRWRVVAVGAAVAAAASLYAWVGRGSTLPTAAVAASFDTPKPIVASPPTPAVAVRPLPSPSPSLRAPLPVGATIHPLAGPERILPGADGTFGVERPGDRPLECRAGHCGIDLAADEGTAVLAMRSGVVESVHIEPNGRGGRWIKIDHGGGFASLYFHLDEIRDDLEPGARVAAGEIIATLGRTGVVSSPTHLHFAVTVDGTYIDPLPFVRTAVVVGAEPPRRELAAESVHSSDRR